MIIDPRTLRAALVLGSLSIVMSCANADEEAPPVPMNLQGQVEFAKKDLAQRLDVGADSVELSGARHVTWRSGALGCPLLGMNYTQVLVPGSIIYLKADDTLHAYHAKIGEEPFYCPRERVQPPMPDDGQDPT